MTLTVVQVLPALDAGGVERGTIEIAGALAEHGHRSIVISGGGRLEPQLTACGSEHITLPVGKKSLLTLKLIPRLRAILRDCRADIVHARSRMPAWIAYLAWRGVDNHTRPGFVTSVHGPYSVNPYSGVMIRGQRVIAISAFIRDYILASYPSADPRKIVTIPRGVDPGRFPHGFRPDAGWLQSWRAEYPQLENRYLITLPARITHWKGQRDFIHILAALKNSGLEAHGLIVGGADTSRRNYLAELHTLVQRLHLQRHITFTGHRQDLREIMSISRLVVSLASEPEAFGRTALESLALGIPVIAYDHGGAGEVLRAMFPAGLIKPGDTAAAIDLIRRFNADPPQVARQNPFPLQRMINDTLGVYHELAGDRGRVS
jgi:glycosyltransferase involved in cell wall biosynthesis